MKKIFTAVAFIICSQLSVTAQTYFRVGPSILANYHWFDELVYSNTGVEVSAEYSLSRKLTVNIPLVVHYGEHENFFDEAVTTKNRLIGVSPEIRYHPSKRYSHIFYGLGGEIKHLNSRNFIPPDENHQSPTLVNWEYNLGISIGQNQAFRKGLLSPYIYFGFGTSNNEYTLNYRVGCTYGFRSKTKMKPRFNKTKGWQ